MNTPQLTRKSQLIRADGLCLRYILYETDLSDQHRKSYAIRIQTDEDDAMAEDITSLEERAVALFDILVEGAVTPCTLTDVLEDLL